MKQVGAKAIQAGAISMVLMSCLLIAIVPNLSKFAYEAGASVPMVIIGRYVITVLLLAGIVLSRQRSLLVSWRVFRLCAIGGIATACTSFGMVGAIAHIDLSLVILIFYTHPVFIAWFGHLTGTYTLSRFRVFCCALILVGLALALSVSLERLNVMGVLLALLGAVGVSGMLIANGKAVRESGTLIVNFYASIIALIPACAIAFTVGPLSFPATNLGWLALLGTGVAMCVGLALFFAALGPIGLVRATMITVTEPLLAIFLAMAMFGERLSAVQWIGVGVVVAGLLLLEMPLDRVGQLLGFVALRNRKTIS